MNSKICPSCHQALPQNAPAGLCPACVMRAAFASSPAIPGPSIADLQAAFPQLEILECIGRGSMGIVYKARQPHLDRLVALKILVPDLQGDPGFAERFTREARMLAKLTHPNLVAVHDFGESGGFYYLLMEYVDGVNLRQAMRTARFTPEQALALIPDLCSALQFAHDQGVMHRDIKPENILLDKKGRVKMADFGIACLVGENAQDVRLTFTGAALGSAAYMAPEQIEHPEDVDHRADIYSLGVVFYEMLTGGLPLGRFPAPSEKSNSDPRLDEVVFRALEKERERRYQNAREVKDGVEGYADSPGDFLVGLGKTRKSGFPKGSKQIKWSIPSAELRDQKEHYVGIDHDAEGRLAVWAIGLTVGGVIGGTLGLMTSPLLLGLGATALMLGLIGCWWSLWRIRNGLLKNTYTTVLKAVSFWPVAAAITVWGCFGWGSWVLDNAMHSNKRMETHYPVIPLFFLFTFLAPVMLINLLKGVLPRSNKNGKVWPLVAAVSSCVTLLVLLGMVINVTKQSDFAAHAHPGFGSQKEPLRAIAFLLSPIPVVLSLFSTRPAAFIISLIGVVAVSLSMFDFG